MATFPESSSAIRTECPNRMIFFSEEVLQRNVINVVQEYGAGVGKFEAAKSALGGARKGPGFVSKEP